MELRERKVKQILLNAQTMAYPNYQIAEILKPLYSYVETVEDELDQAINDIEKLLDIIYRYEDTGNDDVIDNLCHKYCSNSDPKCYRYMTTITDDYKCAYFRWRGIERDKNE